MAACDSINGLLSGKIMRGNKFRTYAGIITILLLLAAFIPSALSQAEWTAVTEAGTVASTGATGSSPTGPSSGEMKFTGIGMGTIAVGTAIAEASVIAVAASQSISAKSTTVH